MLSIEDRLQRAEATLEIIKLESRYGRAWDSGDADEWARVFAPDGIIEIWQPAGKPAIRTQGRSALRDLCAKTSQTLQGLHLLHLPEVTIQGEVAEGRLHFDFVAMASAVGKPIVPRRMCGHYHVKYVLLEDQWLISHKIEKAFADLRTEYHGY